MTLNERLKLGLPLNALLGVCDAARSIRPSMDVKLFAELLVRRADELEAVWDEINQLA